MGRGLSDLQRRIRVVVHKAVAPVAAGEILDARALPKTPAARASMSRALRRLVERRAIDALGTEVARTGRGYLYAPHDPARPCAPPDFVQIRLRR